jgi:hypothetical protein
MAQLTVDLPESVPADEARLAGYTRPTFIELLAKRGEPFTNIDGADLDQELAAWRAMASPTAPR